MKHKTTLSVGCDYQLTDPYGALSMPVYRSVAFEFDNSADMTEAFSGRSGLPDYSRVGNPTVTALERRVAALSGASAVTAFNSGMAAITAVIMAVARQGGNIVTSRHLFGNTYSLLASTLGRLGLETRFVDLTDPAAVDAAVDADTSAIFLEIVTNPHLEVADLRRLADISRRGGFPLIADTTMLPFSLIDARGLGVDFEVVSSTKYVSGGATSLGGLVLDYGRFPDITPRLKVEILMNLGAYMTPDPAWQQLLGLETMELRYRRQEATAMELARRLEKAGKVKVNYIGLESHPSHSLAAELYGTYGAMLTIELPGREECFRFIDSLELVHRATNLFDNRTLAIHPWSTIFVTLDEDTRARLDISDRIIRLSVGLEDVDDVEADINQAIDKAIGR